MIGRRNSGVSARRLAAVGFAAALTALAAAAPARAESFFFNLFSPDVPAGAIRQAIERSGYTLRSAIVRRGDVYLCDVADRSGVGQRFIIDAHKGTLLQRYALPREALGETRREDLNARPAGDDWRYGARPEADVPTRLPYREEYVNIAPNGDAEGPTDVPRPHVVARGPAAPLQLAPPPVETKPPSPPERPKVHVAKPAPAPTVVAPTATVTSASVDPRASATIVVPASTITPQPTPSAATPPPTPAASDEPKATEPKTAEAETAKPAPSPSAAPTAKKSVNDIPVAPLD